MARLSRNVGFAHWFNRGSVYEQVEESMSDSHRRSYGFRTVLGLVSALVFSTVAAVAQLSTASLNGVVRDTTGASVSRASVTLHNSDTSVERNTLTNDV